MPVRHGRAAICVLRTENWNIEGESRRADLLQTWQQKPPPQAQLPGDPWPGPALASSCCLFQHNGIARCGFPYLTLTTLVGLFADLAWFVGGGKILKTKGWLKSPTTGLMALALFFNGLQRMTRIFAAWQLVSSLCLVVGAKPFLRILE